MKKLCNVLSFVLALMLALSCNTPRYVHSPAAHNVPVLTQKGDGKIGGYYSTNLVGREIDENNDKTKYNNSNGFDLQGAVAITDHFAIQANYFNRREKTFDDYDTVSVRYKRNLTELGLGYYVSMGEKKKVLFQIFAGAGLGRFSFTDVSPVHNYYHQADVLKIYLQPAFVFRSPGSFSIALSFRNNIIKYNNIKTNYTPILLKDYKLDSLNYGMKFFLEPAFAGSFGFKNVPGLRLEFQMGLSALLSSYNVDHRVFNFSVGTWLDIGSLFKIK